jgi:signal transduction histidine kinase
MRDEFISVAAHELRTPLTALQLKLGGLGSLVTRNPAALTQDVPRLAGRVDSALRQVERMAELVERLLDVSRIEGGRLELRRELLDLGQLLSKTVEDFREQFASAGCPVSLDILAGDFRGYWDPRRLEQVFGNLFSNAIKYGSNHPVEVRLERRGDEVLLSVRDHGIGISEEDLVRIFSRFERAAAPGRYAGLGLGLYITRHLVTAHGGEVNVTSTPGQGATFQVQLPCQTPPPDSVGLDEASPEAP